MSNSNLFSPSPKSPNITLRQSVKQLLEKQWQLKRKRKEYDESFGSYVNDILQDSMDIIEIYGDNIYRRFQSDAKILLKFLELAENIKNQPEAIRRFYYINMEQNFANFLGIRTPEGEFITQDKLDTLIQSLFDSSVLYTYTGTTILPPSEYYSYLPNFLTYHNAAIKNNKIKESTRILIISERELYQDYEHFHDKFTEFINWHKDPNKNVHLYYIDPTDALEILNQCVNKPPSLTISLYEDNYSLNLLYRSIHKSSFNDEKMISAQLSYLGETYYESSQEFLDKIKQSHKLKDLVSFYDELELNKKEEVGSRKKLLQNNYQLAYSWPEIVNWEKRIETSIKFLKQAISGRYPKKSIYQKIKILDASAGIGCESYELARTGYSITYNEPDRNLFELSIHRLLKEKGLKSGSIRKDEYHELLQFDNGIKIEAYNLPWSFLKYSISEDDKFQIVYSLGNFILHNILPNISKDLEDLKNIMQKDATLIIDHRNTTKLDKYFNNNDELGDAYINNYHANYMYCSDKNNGIILTPINKKNGIFELKYKDIKKNKWLDPTITMLDLHVKDFVTILISCGFKFPEIYGSNDLKKPIITNQKELDEFKEDHDNDFFIYITDIDDEKYQ